MNKIVNDFSITVGTVNGSGSSNRQHNDLARALQDGNSRVGQKFIPFQHSGFANVVHHTR